MLHLKHQTRLLFNSDLTLINKTLSKLYS